MKRDIQLYIEDIIKNCDLVEKYINGVTEKEFENNVMLQDAVIRRIEIIGEAVGAIPDSVKEIYPNIQWAEAKGMRNFLVHEYFGVRVEIVWVTITKDIPLLKKQLENITLF
ncbi:MAG: HepT-like ribonuclease domain-containing protein [Patescibacteria group bacterium]